LRNLLGSLFKILGVISGIVFGLWGLIVLVGVVNEVAGFFGVVVGFMLFPVMFVVAPFYALVAWGNWLPLIIVYGGGILTAILYGIGSLISGEE